jgi:hypothetical protein
MSGLEEIKDRLHLWNACCLSVTVYTNMGLLLLCPGVILFFLKTKINLD